MADSSLGMMMVRRKRVTSGDRPFEDMLLYFSDRQLTTIFYFMLNKNCAFLWNTRRDTNNLSWRRIAGRNKKINVPVRTQYYEWNM